MKNSYKGLILALFAFLYTGNTNAQSNNYEFHIVYSFMKAKDVSGLKNAITSGVEIDTPDSNGINTLCHAIYQKDYDGYNLLLNLKANPKPPCLKRMSAKYRDSFFDTKPDYDRYAFLNPTQKSTIFTPKTQTIGTAALFGGLAIGAMTLTSGGGGDDEGEGEGGGDTGGEDTQFFEAPKNDDPALIADQEAFKGGNFLGQINAQYAYGRGYDGFYVKRNTDGTLVDKDNPYDNKVVNVVVYDNGVYAQNPKLAPNMLKDAGGNTVGFNFDFGPCTAANDNKCYSFDTATQKLMFQDGVSATPVAVGDFTQEKWDSYISHYASGYQWNLTDSTPHYVLGADNPADPTGTSGHGTHVAGIIGAKPDGGVMQGVVPNVALIPVTFNAFGGVNSDMAMLDSVLSQAGLNAQIVNMSYGPAATDDFNAASYGTYFDNHTGLDAFFEANKVLVVAAGNESQTEANAISAIPKVIEAANGLFITVVAVDGSNSIADYSNHCGSAAAWCIAAPGGTSTNPIISTNGPNSTGGMYGTSMAAPTVTGSLALLLSAFPNLTPQQAVDILFKTADSSLGSSDLYGHGLLDLNAATNPVGLSNIPLGNTTTSNLVSLNNTRISLPYNMTNIVDQLPEKLIFLDEYSRPYPLATQSLFTTTDHDDKLKNDMKHFVNRSKVSKVAVNDNLSMSFSNRISDPIDDIQLGSLEFDYQVDKKTHVGFFFSENTAYEHGDYFSKVLSNPFLNINDAVGIKSGYEFNDALSFDVAMYTGQNGFYNDDQRLRLQNDNDFNAIDYVFNFTPADFITFGFKGGFLQEDGSVLGMKGSGAFATDNTLTAYSGLEIGINPTDNLSITAAYYQGSSQTNGGKSNTLMSLSDIKSESISLDVGYKLDQENKLGFQVAQPLAISNGNMLFDLPVSRDPTEDIIHREQYNISMKPEAKELDLGLYFTHETKEDKWFRAELGTRINPDNRDIAPDYRMMLGFGAPLN